MIKKIGNTYAVTTSSGDRILGKHKTKKEASAQLAAIEISKAKHMKENKTFREIRSELNENEYSAIVTGNRSARTNDTISDVAGAKSLANLNAMLSAISRSTYLDPIEAFNKIRVRLNIALLDIEWNSLKSHTGEETFTVPVRRYSRVDGVDAITGEIRMDGRANNPDGSVDLFLRVEVSLNADSLYVVDARLMTDVDFVPVGESTDAEVAADAARDRIAVSKFNKKKKPLVKEETEQVDEAGEAKLYRVRDARDKAYVSSFTDKRQTVKHQLKQGKLSKIAGKLQDKVDKARARRAGAPPEVASADSPFNASGKNTRKQDRLYTRRRTAIDKFSTAARAKKNKAMGVAEDVEQIDELSPSLLGRYVNKAAADISSKNWSAGRLLGNDQKSNRKLRASMPERVKLLNKGEKRQKGIGKAIDRLTKKRIPGYKLGSTSKPAGG